MWITDMAVAAILMPLAKSICEEEGLKPMQSNFGKALLISCAYGPLIGGIATPAGCGANPIAMQFLKTLGGIDINFLDWMVFGVPAAFLMVVPCWLILKFFFPFEMTHLKKTKAELKAEFKDHPPMNKEEKVTLSIFLLTVALWLFSPLIEAKLKFSIPISMTVLITFPLFWFPWMSTLKWKQIERDIDWAGILLIVSGISLGTYLYKSGAAGWLAFILLGKIGSIPLFLQVFAVALGVCFLKVVFSSNTVTATIIIPLIIALGKSLNLDMLGITLAAGLTSSLAFILVTTTPTNVIPYTAGYFSIKDMAKVGIVLSIVGSAIVAIVFVIILQFYRI
jgi:sodium-dependent dicarboxylate transporter 2/3/5